MDSLPDFSNSKIVVMNRIEGAIKERRKRPNLYQYTLFFSFFLFAITCTSLYFKSIIFKRVEPLNPIDYKSLEKLLLSEELDSNTVIKVPGNLSLSSLGDAKLILSSDYNSRIYE